MGKTRIKRIQEKLKKNEAAILINAGFKDPHFFWLTQIELEYAFLIITRETTQLFVPEMEFARAKEHARCDKLKMMKNGLKDLRPSLQKKRSVYVNYSGTSVHLLKKMRKNIKGVRYKDASKILREVRMLKDDDEIKKIKKACQITAKIFKELLHKMDTMKTERDIKVFIEERSMQLADGSSFPTIVASGKNGAAPHHETTHQKLKRGFCVIDFGVKYKGYISDVTRTIFFGTPTSEERKDYEKVLQANQSAINEIKEGTPLKKLDKISRKEFDYPHSLGHGIGVEVHEAPNVSANSKERVKQEMCFTIEPGLYKKGEYGIRIEDDILVSKKTVVLTQQITKKLLMFKITKQVDPIKIIKKYYQKTPLAYKILITHVKLVTKKALKIAKRVPELHPNMKFIREAAMLHDIGINQTNAPDIGCTGKHPYICHGSLGAELLRKEGLPKHANVCERHTGVGLTQEEAKKLKLPSKDMSPKTIEEQIICFADKFYSKDPKKLQKEKTTNEIKQELNKYGNEKVKKFERWVKLFKEGKQKKKKKE